MAELPEIKATSTASSISVRSLHRGGGYYTRGNLCV
nr:MAG TPA: hypothetical protein [Caudoviricetes sp.]